MRFQVLATSPEFNEEQLLAARKPLWQQTGEPLVTLEAAREFIDRFGLVAFAPGRLALTAPSLVEATLGESKDATSAEDAKVARDLVSRLVEEGTALPLNLLGGGGDTPDFVASGSAFKYIFTLRGDKTWKQPPSTTGSAKVSPLALRVFEVLTTNGAMTAPELANELGREVTEAAIVRALSELWQMLRVIPRLALGDGTTMWELTNKRFTKAIKAGVNAGQPTALSAMVSLYLAQSLAATEDELETFLSPLAPRSRVREVIHALVSARELETVAVAGKTLLYVSGDLPVFPELAAPEPAEGEVVAVAETPARVEFSETETPEPGRIRKFERERPAAGAPVRKPAGAFDRKPREERERRPFTRRDDGAAKSSFTKPWDEERKPRREAGAEGEDRPKRPYVRREGGGDRPPFAPRGDRKPFGARKPFSADGGDRPKRPYVRREGSEGASSDRPKRPYVRREGGNDRPPFAPRGDRKPFGARKPFSADGGDRPKRPYVRREGGEGFSSDRPKRPYVRREGGGDRPPFAPRGDRKPFGADGGDRPKRPYVRREGGEGFSADRPKRPYVRREDGGDRPPFAPRGDRKPFGERKPFSADGGDRPKRPYVRREQGEGFSADRPKRPYVRREGGSGDRPFTPRGPRKPFDPDRKPFVRREGGEGEGRSPRKSFGSRPPSGGASGGGFKRSGGAGGFKRAGGPGAFKGGFKGKPAGGKFDGGKPRGNKPGTPKPKREPEE